MERYEEEEESPEEDAEENRGFSWKKFLKYSIPIFLMLIVLVAAAAVSVIYFMPNSAFNTHTKPFAFIEDNNGNDTDRHLRQRQNDVDESEILIQKFHIDFVEVRLNFTDAEVFCNRKNSTLVVLFNQPEEEYFLQAVNDHGDFLDDCHNGGFIGYRMILEEELKVDGIPMLTFTGELTGLNNMWLENHFDPNKECAVLIYHPTSSKYGLKSEPCVFEASCHLCETTQGCPRDYPLCYVWRHTINHTETYQVASKFCMEKKNGRLARIRNQHMMEGMIRQLQITAGKLFMLYSKQACGGGYYISKQQMDLGPLGFESIDEHQINYISHTIKLEKQPFGAHCLGVVRDNRHEISFSPVRCDKERCFFCRSERTNATNT